MGGYDTILFDSDGVLVEPPLHESQLGATRTAFEEVGIGDPGQQQLLDIVDGLTSDQLHEICSAHELDAEVFWEARERHDEQAQLHRFKDGIRGCYDDVTAISRLSQNRGVVSNNHQSTIEFVLNFFDLQPWFDTYYGREKTVESLTLKKPNPHYIKQALADLNAESALYVGDSESDIVAANRAGIDSVFVRRPHSREGELTTPPTYEASDLHDLVAIVDSRT